MYKAERKKDIMALLRQRGFSSTQNLAKQLRVSQTTIYRYLTELEEEGLIRKEYGGATLGQAPVGIDLDYGARRLEHPGEKRAIAERAVALVEPGDTVILDSSTTCVAFAQRLVLAALHDVTIVTNSPRIVLALQHRPEFRLICTGGTYLARHDTLVGSPAEEFVGSLTANKCFVSAMGVTPQACTDADPADVRVKRLMLSRARMKILLVDHGKFGRTTTFTVISPAELDLIITDDGTSAKVLEPYLNIGLTVLSAAPVNGPPIQSPRRAARPAITGSRPSESA
jgi:DeoR/GlpR family transcriptional regulator of sugar metabolism